MGVTQEGQKCIFMLCMEVAEEDMEVQEETVYIALNGSFQFEAFPFMQRVVSSSTSIVSTAPPLF